ncbi:NHL repeat-containing protein 3 isoform X1 [Pogona vitticeps]
MGVGRGGSRLRMVAALSGACSLLLLIAWYRVGSDLQVLNPVTVYSFWRTGKPFYKLDISWPKSPEKLTGQTFCVAVDHINGLVYVGQRGDDNVPKVVVFSEAGYFLNAWNTTVEMPHGIFALNTPNASSVWITDVGTGKDGHTIKQYSPSGQLLQVIGTPGEAGSGINPLQLDQPAELFVEPTGDIYIVDGDGGLNNRLFKVTQDLKTVWLHGENGIAITQFRIPHSVTVDSVGRLGKERRERGTENIMKAAALLDGSRGCPLGRIKEKKQFSLGYAELKKMDVLARQVWVADRANWRIQVFDKITGEWLGSWSSCFTEDAPYSVRFTPDEKFIIVAHLNTDRISILAAPPVGSIGDCIVVDTIQLAHEVKPHLLDVSKETGAVYVAEIGAQQVQKYVPLQRHRKLLAPLSSFGWSSVL